MNNKKMFKFIGVITGVAAVAAVAVFFAIKQPENVEAKQQTYTDSAFQESYDEVNSDSKESEGDYEVHKSEYLPNSIVE